MMPYPFLKPKRMEFLFHHIVTIIQCHDELLKQPPGLYFIDPMASNKFQHVTTRSIFHHDTQMLCGQIHLKPSLSSVFNASYLFKAEDVLMQQSHMIQYPTLKIVIDLKKTFDDDAIGCECTRGPRSTCLMATFSPVTLSTHNIMHPSDPAYKS